MGWKYSSTGTCRRRNLSPTRVPIFRRRPASAARTSCVASVQEASAFGCSKMARRTRALRVNVSALMAKRPCHDGDWRIC